ncbi:MAG TPA: hypothetical protein VKV22_14080 [Rhodanobacteraceae bacterium]|nr:hypothetical protein [Rhodanobacteraceae bacterium]
MACFERPADDRLIDSPCDKADDRAIAPGPGQNEREHSQMDRDDILQQLVPHSLAAVSALALALKYRTAWDAPKRMEIYFDGKLSVEGNSNAFVNPAIEAGLIHCRALLEFLGLCAHDGRLENIKLPRCRKDDVGIESFSNSLGPLPLLTPTAAVSHYTGPALEAERALPAVFHAANKGFAHFTTGLTLLWSMAMLSRLRVAATCDQPSLHAARSAAPQFRD